MSLISKQLVPSDYAGTSLLSYSHQWRDHILRQSYYSAHSSLQSSMNAAPLRQKEDDTPAVVTAATVFGLAFYVDTTSSNDYHHQQWLIGCTSQGEVCIWKLQTGDAAANVNQRPDEDEDDDEMAFESLSMAASSTTTMTKPAARLKVSPHGGALYSCKIVPRDNQSSTNTDSTWLVVSGIDGVWILDWAMDVMPHLNGSTAPSTMSMDTDEATHATTASTCSYQQHFMPYPSATMEPFSGGGNYGTEINDCLVLNGNSSNHVYGAASDAFGCYKWDLETAQVVTTYRLRPAAESTSRRHGKSSITTSSTSSGYHQTMAHVPETNLILMGGEGGTLYIWDVATDQYVDTINMNAKLPAITSNSGSSSTNSNNNSVASMSATTRSRSPVISTRPAALLAASSYSSTSAHVNGHGRFISSCLARDENWWMVAGGGGGGDDANSGGFISTIHGPTRSLVSTVQTRETPQQLALVNSDSNNRSRMSTLVSVANESYVSHWPNPFALDAPSTLQAQAQPQRVWCNQASAYAIAVSADGRQLATGGVPVGSTGSAVVDLFDPETQSSIQLSIY